MNETESNVYLAVSYDFLNLPNSVIGYKFNEHILALFKKPNLEHRHYMPQRGFALVADVHFRLYYEISRNDINRHLYNGGDYSLFYTTYGETFIWEQNGRIAYTYPNFRPTGLDVQGTGGVAYGKRGEILDAHVLKKGFYFTVEGQTVPNLNSSDSYSVLSYLNSIVTHYTLNLYTGQHKPSGYMQLLPMPDFSTRKSEIDQIVDCAITIKRKWFSFDETNLEYRGFLAQLGHSDSFDEILNDMQEKINGDKEKYFKLVSQNDDLWMDLANIDRDCEFRKTLNEYKSRRPYEELLSIDGASTQNMIDKKVLAQEVVQELVGIVFGRWDVAYAKGDKPVPEFGDVFDALPFMPAVSLESVPANYPLNIAEDGILSNQMDSDICLTTRVRDAMHYIWGEKADDLEFELCNLIGCKNLQSYFEQPSGFFDYHFKRYTKSRRKAPIYWLLSSEDGSVAYWVYYPKLSKNTLPALTIKLRNEQERLKSELNKALAAMNKNLENSVRARLEQVEDMMAEIAKVESSGYVPNHDDGVPVTSAPLVNLVSHRGWKQECADNMKMLEDGEYDWSHLAMSMFTARVTQKAKKDWCLALTHGLEHLCENKPKEKKPRGKKIQEKLNLS